MHHIGYLSNGFKWKKIIMYQIVNQMYPGFHRIGHLNLSRKVLTLDQSQHDIQELATWHISNPWHIH